MRLFIIDDHILTCSGFKQEFESELGDIEVVGYATNLSLAISEIKQLNVQIIVLDLFIKLLDPVGNIRYLRKTFPTIPIVVISYETSLEWQVTMFNEGARSFLNKADEILSMKNIFYQVIEGKTIFPDEVIRTMNPSNISNSEPILLPEDHQMINDLSNGRTIKEIADSKNTTTSAVDKKFKKLRDKFRARTNYQLLAFLFKLHKI